MGLLQPISVPPPLTPSTPSDLFAALALSPSLGITFPNSVPTIEPSPRTNTFPIQEHTDPLPKEDIRQPRPLTTNEARQLTLLLEQHLWPHRSSPKLLMKESINLAEKLHEAGIRWDRHRRVMGMHLRGIWEEGQRLIHVHGNTGRGGLMGHRPIDLYVQGSFLSIAEEPHPLDPMPLPIEVHPASFASLPKLTLQAGLFNTLPMHTIPDYPNHHQITQEPAEIDSNTSEDQEDTHHQAENVVNHSKTVKSSRRRWLSKNLSIRIEQSHVSSMKTPLTPFNPALVNFGVDINKWSKLGMKGYLTKLSKRSNNSGNGKKKGAHARKVSVGGWEVR